MDENHHFARHGRQLAGQPDFGQFPLAFGMRPARVSKIVPVEQSKVSRDDVPLDPPISEKFYVGPELHAAERFVRNRPATRRLW
jgi:hypothetical protein